METRIDHSLGTSDLLQFGVKKGNMIFFSHSFIYFYSPWIDLIKSPTNLFYQQTHDLSFLYNWTWALLVASIITFSSIHTGLKDFFQQHDRLQMTDDRRCSGRDVIEGSQWLLSEPSFAHQGRKAQLWLSIQLQAVVLVIAQPQMAPDTMRKQWKV